LDSLPENYYIKSVRLGQVDVRNELSITGPVSAPIEVVLSGNAAQLEGTVIDKDRKPVANAQAVLIPDDRRERAAANKTAVSDQNGRFTMQTILPGNYKLFAWEDIEPYAYLDPDFLRKYEELSIPVSVSESGRLNVEAKVIPATQ
jgi:Carboxypeptidase regulatory-like domain